MTATEAEKWFKKAELDLDAASYLFNGRFYEESAFHCQQSVEKALKSLYLKKFNKLIKTHELVFLGKKVGAPKEILGLCEVLTPFFVQTRYPGYEEDLSEEEAEEIIAKARKVIEWVKNNI